MLNKKPGRQIRICWLAVLVAALIISSLSVAAQDQDETTRRLWDTAFIKPGRQVKQKRAGARRYRLTTPAIPVTGVVGDSVVGVTVWRLRRPLASDSGERLLVQEGSEEEAWIPERISGNTRLNPGDRVRVSVEAARAGYLYVIDREQYADGSFSEPYLIFPTTRTLNGDNKVDRGKLIEIPAQDDGPPYFTLKRSRPDQVAEVLSMLITPEPLTNVEITDKAQKLSAAQVGAWEKQWSIQVGSVELEGGAGQTWTKEEKEAGANRHTVLRAHAPAPQLVYYREGLRAAEPMLLKVQLRYHPSTKTRSR
jgi:hypothetical protein